MPSSPLDELKSLNQARTSLMACQSVDEVVQKALKLVRDKLNSQVASIFLFTKDGVIKRKGINGITFFIYSVNPYTLNYTPLIK